MSTRHQSSTVHSGPMAAADEPRHSGTSPKAAVKSEASLADGTGEGNAPIEATSASSDPEVLAGAAGEETATSLNADDYPENIAEAAGAVDDPGPADSSGPGDGGKPQGDEDATSGQRTMPDEAAGVDGDARPD